MYLKQPKTKVHSFIYVLLNKYTCICLKDESISKNSRKSSGRFFYLIPLPPLHFNLYFADMEIVCSFQEK